MRTDPSQSNYYPCSINTFIPVPKSFRLPQALGCQKYGINLVVVVVVLDIIDVVVVEVVEGGNE